MSVKRKAPPRKAAPAPAEHECLCMGFGPELGRMLRSFGSDSAKEHFRSARLEALRGIRDLIDRRIESLSKRPGRGTSIEID
jgi:hypothetical protein